MLDEPSKEHCQFGCSRTKTEGERHETACIAIDHLRDDVMWNVRTLFPMVDHSWLKPFVIVQTYMYRSGGPLALNMLHEVCFAKFYCPAFKKSEHAATMGTTKR